MWRASVAAILGTAFVLVSAAPAFAGDVTVSLAGAGTGTVTSAPAGIDCSNTGGGTPGPACEFTFDSSVFSVMLMATPDPGFTFTGWSGSAPVGDCDSGSANPCSFFTFLGPATITATFEVQETPPEVAIDDVLASEITGTEATFHGTVDPNGSALTACRFEWVPEADSDGFSGGAVESAPCDPDPGSGDDPVEVSATATGLEPNTAYRVRLLADKQTTDEVVDVAAPFTTDAIPPQITEMTAIPGATMATLHGRVNARNSTTQWSLEYRSAGVSDWIVAAEGEAQGNSWVGVVARPLGLEPESSYELRIVAESAAGEEIAGPEPFSTGVPPPERAYELVSPLPTEGVNIMPGNGAGSVTARGVAADGSRAHFGTFGWPLPGFGDLLNQQYIAERGDRGWTTHAVDNLFPAVSIAASPADASVALLRAGDADPDDQNGAQDLYLGHPDGRLEWITRDPRIPPGTPQTEAVNPDVGYQGSPGTSVMSADGSVVIFRSSRNLLDADPHPSSGTGPRLYRWDDGELSLVSVYPGASDPPSAADVPTGAVLGNTTYHPNAVSRDGSRVFWQDRSGANARLFVQVDGEGQLEASAPQGGLSGTPGAITYGGAAADGSRVFFTANRRLTPDSGGSHTTGSGDDDLYAYDVDAALAGHPEPLRDLTPRLDGGDDPNDPPAPADRARVLGVAAVSDDGSHVYFVADGQLEYAEPAPDGSQPSPEGRNLYLAELGEIDGPVRVRFIAGPLGGDTTGGPTDDGRALWGASGAGWTQREAHTSPDGSVLAFSSGAELVPGQPLGGTRQLYVYDDDAGTLTCASCPGDGSPPAGRVNRVEGSTENFVSNGQAKPRWVAADGTVFFHTPTRLLPADANRTTDVYAYRRGELVLISAGTGGEGSRFFAASADGRTAFFLTRDALVPRDDEPGVRKLYAARVGGGFPAPPAEPECWEDGCQGQPTAPPSAPAPRTSGPPGAGNPDRGRGDARRCGRLDRRAGRAQRKTKRLRRAARRARKTEGKRAKRLKRRARLMRKQAQRLGRRADRCARRSSR